MKKSKKILTADDKQPNSILINRMKHITKYIEEISHSWKELILESELNEFPILLNFIDFIGGKPQNPSDI